MKRRKFVTAAAASTLVSPLAYATTSENNDDSSREIYDLQTYELTFGGDRQALMQYLKEVKSPYLNKMGAKHYMMFTELGNPEPAKLWTLTAYPDFDSYQNAVAMGEEALTKQSQEYASAGQTYNRISSSLLYALEGIRQMKEPIENAGLFELRIYEGVNEDAVRRKIKMFNKEELDLFYKVDLNPIFFGNMIVGPYMPSLVYMLNYRDMSHRTSAWKEFVEHPEWNAMKVKEEYANSVSNIRKIFLERA